jgi:S-adenosylmethionine:tRNA ribosyltransferase-isomerase
MPSAGRAFTWRLLFALQRRGVEVAHVVLHTGLSSFLDDELDAQHPASEEEYFISACAAEKINRARSSGRRVIAVGTTVVRALESAADNFGQLRARHGYTRLHITAKHALRAVDGLLTGLHEPEASHLDLLTAFLPAQTVQAAYERFSFSRLSNLLGEPLQQLPFFPIILVLRQGARVRARFVYGTHR